MATHKDMISSEEARIMLLEQRNDDFHQTLVRLESKIDSLDKKFDSKFDSLDKKFDSKFDAQNARMDAQNARIDSHFRTTVYMILGLYGGAVVTLISAVGKAYHWL